MLVFYSPKADVFLSTGDQFIALYWAEFNCEDIEVADLFGKKDRFSCKFYLADIEDKYCLSFVWI